MKCVIFDLDGVITETSDQHFEAWQHLAKQLGITLEPSFEEKLKGISRLESLEIILKEHNKQDDYTDKEKTELTDIKNEYYRKLLQGFTEKNINQGVIRLLEYLKTNNIFLALGSASKNSPFILEALQIGQYFDYIVNPVGKRSKPAPDIFLDAAQHFNLSTDTCIGIEDAVAGISAINNSGMLSIGIGDKTILSHADVVYQDVAHLDYNEFKTILDGEYL
ncbi:MAG: beta-phosphoglucomutase [Candidatus Izimaplasma sp.]|nr:beta-phosphoglucomutase [Candidatus Izimaplasma bacterium]